MGKHHDKIKKALEQRIASTPNGAGFKKPGSMNKKKTGYRGQTAKGSKQCLVRFAKQKDATINPLEQPLSPQEQSQIFVMNAGINNTDPNQLNAIIEG